MRRLLFATALALLMAASVSLQILRDRRYGDLRFDARLLYVPSGRVLEKLSLSFDAIMADVYWIRAIQHYGGDRLSDRVQRFELLHPLLDITTTLDPRFSIAYRFGAIFLSEPYPGGAGRPDLAISLLEKGLRVQPEKWQYYQDIGFIHYQRGDYQAAAKAFQQGSERRGAPWWMRSLAAVTFAKGGSRDASRFLWQQILDDATDPWLRGNATMRLQQLQAMDEIDRLTAIVKAYARGAGRLPDSWDAVIAAGLLGAQPTDPTRVPYVLDSLTGEVMLAPASTLAPLPTGLRPAEAPRP